MALDSNNKVHISYLSTYEGTMPTSLDDDEVKWKAKYITNKTGSWSTPDYVNASFNGGWLTSLAMDINNDPNILYWYYNSGLYLKYATKEAGGNWDTSSTLDFGTNKHYCSLAISSSNLACATFYNGNLGALKGKSKTIGSGSWGSIRTIAEDIGTGASNGAGTHATAFDSNGRIYIVYYSDQGKALLYTYSNDALQNMSTPVTIEANLPNPDSGIPAFAAAAMPSIAIDSNNNIHIAYLVLVENDAGGSTIQYYEVRYKYIPNQ